MATISTRISLEGSDEIAKQLEELAKAGATVFKQIEDAAQKADIKLDPATQKSFDELAATGAKLAGQFEELAKAASGSTPEVEKVGEAAATSGEQFDKLGEAATKSADAIAKVDEASKQVTSNVAKSGEAAQESSKSYASLGLEVVRTGASVATAASGMAKATAGLGLEAVTAAASVGTFALVLAKTLAGPVAAAIVALSELAGWLGRVATADEKLSTILDRLAVSTSGVGETFKKLQVGQAAFERIGVSAETFRGVVAKLAQELANLDAAKALAASEATIDSTTKKALEAQKALIELRIQAEATDIRAPRVPLEDRQKLIAITEQLASKTADVAQAERTYAEAQKERAAAQANNLKNIVELIQQVEAGAKGFKFDEMTTGATKLEAIKIRLQDVAKAGGDVSQSLLKIIANLPRPDAFAIGKQFVLSDTDIDRVRRYGAEATKIPELYAKIQAAGVKLSTEDEAAFDRLAESTQRVESAGARLRQAWESSFFSRIGAEATTVFNNIKASVVEFAASVVENFNKLGSQLATTVGQIFSGLGTLIGQAVAGWGIIIEKFVTTPVANAWQWIADTASSVWESVKGLAEQAYNSVVSFVTTPVSNAWQWIVDTFNSVLQSLGLGGGTPAPAGGGSGFAGGGLLGGGGSGTSDSNLAWVSRGEYIVPARAVAQPGVLALLEALRHSGGNLRGLLNGMGRFAAGGLVVPSFAGGGMAGRDLGTLTLGLPGGSSVTVRASSDVVDQLRHAAAMGQVRSGGRKPSRYS